jgi:hypothetical protein
MMLGNWIFNFQMTAQWSEVEEDPTMTPETLAIFHVALTLPAASKAELAEMLLSSIEEDATAQHEIDQAWFREAKDRFAAFRKGEIQAEPMEEVMGSLKRRHAK